jgi:hypothetical protein
MIEIEYFPSTVWQDPNKLEVTELIPIIWFAPDDGIPGTWLILTSNGYQYGTTIDNKYWEWWTSNLVVGSNNSSE